MKQQVLVVHGSAGGRVSGPETGKPASSARAGGVLPAVNRSRRQPAAASGTADGAKPGEKAPVHGDKVTDQLSLYSRFASRLQLDPLYQSGTATRKGGSEKILVKDKSDRATNEQVLDPRTRLILFKMIGRGVVERIDGCVSTGKEANVYHAISPEGKHIALKIFKTSILVFKDRDRYVTGEFRFKSGYARSNPRKMVRLWAEKELRNLRRMRSAGVRVPEAIEVRENVLVMDFVGQDEWQCVARSSFGLCVFRPDTPMRAEPPLDSKMRRYSPKICRGCTSRSSSSCVPSSTGADWCTQTSANTISCESLVARASG